MRKFSFTLFTLFVFAGGVFAEDKVVDGLKTDNYNYHGEVDLVKYKINNFTMKNSDIEYVSIYTSSFPKGYISMVKNNNLIIKNSKINEGGLGIGVNVVNIKDSKILLDNVTNKDLDYGSMYINFTSVMDNTSDYEPKKFNSQNNLLEISNSNLHNLSSIGYLGKHEVQNNKFLIKNSKLKGYGQDFNILLQGFFSHDSNLKNNIIEIVDSQIKNIDLISMADYRRFYKNKEPDLNEFTNNKIIIKNSKIDYRKNGLLAISAHEIDVNKDGNGFHDFKDNQIKIYDSVLKNLNEVKIHGEKNFLDYDKRRNIYVTNNKIFLSNSGNGKFGNTSVDGKLITPVLETSGQNINIADLSKVLSFEFHLTNSKVVEEKGEKFYKTDGKTPILIVQNRVNLSDKKAKLHFHGNQDFGKNPKFGLIKNSNDKFGEIKVEKGLISKYDSKNLEQINKNGTLYVKLKGENYVANIDKKKGDLFISSQFSQLLNVLKTNDIINSKILNISKNIDLKNDFFVFAYADKYKTKYKNFNSDVKAQTYTFGLAKKNDNLTSGFFTQYSNGKFDEKFQNYSFDSKTKLYDIGFVSKFDFTKFYIDGHAKIGQIQSKNNFNLDEKISKKLKQNFYTLSAFVGNNTNITNNVYFDNKIGLSYAKIESKSVKHNKDVLKLDEIASNKAEIKNSLGIKFDSIFTYLGTNFEYEFLANAKIYEDEAVYEKNYKGFSYGGHLGAGMNFANATILLETDFLKGKRVELNGSLGFVYKF